ncbi:MAG: maleylpyruvate isomerase N-terminal domain-containing protein [Dehalococcoidia bacterium]
MTTTRTFALWVEPIATELRFTRGEIANAARLMLPDIWGWLSPLPGWTYKDLLAHCAIGDWVCQTLLRAAVAGEQIDLRFLDQLNESNQRLVDERKERTPEELIAELEAESEKTQALLAQLSEEHDGLKPEGAPMSLGAFLRDFHSHDLGHLAQLKTATDNVML